MRFEKAELGRSVVREEFEEREAALRVELIEAQYALLSADHDVQILIAGDDREGCQEVIDLLHEWLDARQIDTTVFRLRTEEENQFPFFWRYWRAVPRRGHLGLYYGHWVYDLIEQRYLGELSEKEVARRLREVRSFERGLADSGSILRKLWIHTPRKELGKRLKRLRRRKHGWRAAKNDRLIHEHYDDLVELGERLVAETDAPHAPWTVIEGTDDEYRDLAVAEIVRDALTAPRRVPEARPEMPDPVAIESRLDQVDLTASLERDEYRSRLEKAQTRLADLTFEASEKGLASVLAFEGWDAGGKGGAIRRITRAMAARDYRVVPIAAPTDEEQERHYLWRFCRQLPRAGRMVIFDRTWYGRVLVERIEGFAAEADWRRAYDEIAEFERQLVDDGMLVRKFWLEIDKDEQLRRFEARKETPYKEYKITEEDYRNREKWDAYAEAVDEMIARTHTKDAPWLVVAANDKRLARVTVVEAVCDAIEKALK